MILFGILNIKYFIFILFERKVNFILRWEIRYKYLGVKRMNVVFLGLIGVIYIDKVK